MTPREKAEYAKQLLDNPMFRHVLADLRGDLVDRLEVLPMTAHEDQHEAVLLLQLLRSIPNRLQRYVQDRDITEHKDRSLSFMDRIRESIRTHVP
jgi:hypothetical protein